MSTPEVALATMQARLVFTSYLTVTTKSNKRETWVERKHLTGLV